MKLLIWKGANVDSGDNNGNTTLYWATENTALPVVGLLPVMELIIERGAACVNLASRHGCQPLSWVVERGHFGAVKLPIKNCACVKSAHDTSDTPLSRAATKGNSKIVKQLLENGAYTDSSDDEGRTSLSRAAENGMEIVIKLLVDHGANLESTDHNGWIPLCWAIERRKEGHESVDKLFLYRMRGWEGENDKKADYF